ncbi:MAG: VOC family protein [Halioglobus sp.]|nr:VOC family protein [Halioglobus sp.]
MAGLQKILDPDRFLHFGVIVRDIDQQMEQLSAFWGIGDWSVLEYGAHGAQILKGNPFNLKVALNRAGPVTVEFLQPLHSPDSIWQQFLDERGEGLHHLAYRVDDLAQSIAAIERTGGELLWHISIAPTMNYCYARVPAGMIVELVDFDL